MPEINAGVEYVFADEQLIPHFNLYTIIAKIPSHEYSIKIGDRVYVNNNETGYVSEVIHWKVNESKARIDCMALDNPPTIGDIVVINTTPQEDKIGAAKARKAKIIEISSPITLPLFNSKLLKTKAIVSRDYDINIGDEAYWEWMKIGRVYARDTFSWREAIIEIAGLILNPHIRHPIPGTIITIAK